MEGFDQNCPMYIAETVPNRILGRSVTAFRRLCEDVYYFTDYTIWRCALSTRLLQMIFSVIITARIFARISRTFFFVAFPCKKASKKNVQKYAHEKRAKKRARNSCTEFIHGIQAQSSCTQFVREVCAQSSCTKLSKKAPAQNSHKVFMEEASSLGNLAWMGNLDGRRGKED